MRKQKLLRRMLAMILSAVMVLGSTAVTALGEVPADLSWEAAAPQESQEEPVSQEPENNDSLADSMPWDTPSAESVSGPAILLGTTLTDYQINEDVYSWTDGEQTVTLYGDDILTILNSPPEDAKITIDVASDPGSNVTIIGNASEIYTNVRISVQQDINLTLNNMKIVAPETFGGLFSFPALHWNSSGGAATLTVIGECFLIGSMFSSGLSSTGNQQLTITGNGGGDDRLISNGGSYTIPDNNIGQPVGDGIYMFGLTGEGAKLIIRDITLEATGGNDNGSFGVGGCGIFVSSGNIDIIDATVTAASGYDSHPTSTRAAIYSGGNSNGGGDLTITNSTVTATGAVNVSAVGDAGISASRKVTINSGTVEVRAGESTSANGGGAINASELQITGGTVTATGGNSASQEGGRAIFIWPGELEISGGTMTATAGHSGSQNGGVAIYTGTLQLSGGTVTATGGNGAGNGGHGIFVASGSATMETGINFTAVGGNGGTGLGGVGLRAYGMGNGNTVTIANSAGDIYIRGGQGATVQRPSVMGGVVYIGTGNVGDMVKEAGAGAFSIKNTPDGDDVYMVSASTSPAAEATIRCVVGSGTVSEYTYRSKANLSQTACLWLPAGAQTLKADNYNDTNTTVAANNTNTAVLNEQPDVTPPATDAGIVSILSKSILAGAEAGTSTEPKTASISVANSVSSVVAGDIVKSHAGATVTFYGTDSRFTTPVSGIVTLAPGANTTVYIKITAQDASTVKYYAVTINRASSGSTPDPTPGSGPIVTPAPGPVAGKVERITVDVKQGETDNTVSQIIIDRTTHTDGSKSDQVTYQQEKARETIEKLKEEGKDIARILIPGSGGEVSRTQVTVPFASLNALSEGKVNLQIDTEDVKIEIPKTTLAQANQKLGEDLYFKLIPVREEEEKHEVTQRAIFEVGVINNNENTNISALGIPMTIETNMPSSDVDITLPLSGVSIPVDKAEREAFLAQLAVFIEHSDGDKELVQGEIVEYRPGVLGIKFHIKKFSTFTIVKLEKSSACDVIKVIVPAKATMIESMITATVDNTTKKLTLKVAVSDKASWKLYSDKEHSKELKNRKLTLKVGVNTVYLKTTAEDGKTSKIYTVAITRREPNKKLIIIANKYDFADAFVGGVPALQSGGEVITTGIETDDAKKLVSYIKKNYTKQDKIYILGLEKAINKGLEKLLQKEGYADVERIGGKDKYETAKKTADIVKFSEKAKVILVNGTVKPEEAESIQRICAEKGYPILLVQKNNLTTSTLEALKKIKPNQVYILGDQTTIGTKVADQVAKALKLKRSSIIRIKSSEEIK